ncbi:MAG: ABC transporter substrate-binding protein [Acidimicrobiia bacterium]|nr:ABC transporter substrate-binding protein [Acidimicrobiia bacterium]
MTTTNRWGLTRLLALLLALTLVAAACGGDGDGDTAADDAATGEDSGDATDVSAGDTAEGDVDTEVVEDTESVREYGGTVTVGLEAESTGLRPWEDSCSSPCYNLMVTVFDKLAEQDPDGTWIPYLAESFESNDDFTVWTVKLRDGVTFHNGEPLTSQTLVDMFAIHQTGAASTGHLSTSGLTGVEVVDDLTVDYTLSNPNSAFPAYLTRAPIGMVFEPGAAAADPEGFSVNPVGTGPFMVETRDLDNETVLVRNPDYWMSDPDGNQLPYLDSIVFRPIPDETTRLDSLLSGTVDAIQSLRQSTIRDARAAGDGIVLYEFQGNNAGGGMFNVAVPPYDDVRVRRGLITMQNQEAVIEALGGAGISLPGTQFFSPDSPWFSQAVADAYPNFDFEGGKAILQEYIDDPERSDGKAVGEPIDVQLSCPPDPSLIAAMAVSEQLWTSSELVNVTLTNFDQQTHINTALGTPPDFVGEHGIHCWRWSSEDDPSLTIGPAVAPPNPAIAEAAGVPGVVSPLNFSNWFDGDVFAASIAAVRTDVFEERKALYEQIMLKAAEDVPMYYSGHTATMIATVPEVQGLNGWHSPDGTVGIGFPNAEGRWHEVWRTDLG